MEKIDQDSPKEKKRSQSQDIKSTAVVKYTSVQTPVGYARLQCNTDLNLPPSNWLSSAIDPYGLKQILKHSSQFSSFTMAHMFPDCVGQVDVISSAECIKTLLKLPYQPKGKVSMMVHRVENTILLDEFDIYKYLMKSEWAWLKNFFLENIKKTMNDHEHMISMREETSSSGSLQLMSKFLCHSVISVPEYESKDCLDPRSGQILLDGPTLPEPESKPEADSQANEHMYNRNVLWTFEDIQMLIGSDLPIFGGVDRPCVSLRLRDASQPVNVLTGIDYWLDNLMCNVPEVLMCYHIDGIVQRYEPMKTEDLPNIDGSKFSPKIIKNVAQNILSFLKSNATKPGHTYWLFKGENDDVVKLYDLTSLCGGIGGTDGNGNPFTTPVAMLLYRVARNMRFAGHSKHVKLLLENCIKLLGEEHPQIVASSHYMLADLYLPATTNPACPNFNEESSEESDDEVNGEEFTKPSTSKLALPMTRLAINDIGKHVQHHEEQKSKIKANSYLSSEPPERCGKALHHVLKGLQALHNIDITKCQENEKEQLRKQTLEEEQNPKMANPYEPIKMSYEPLNKQNSTLTNKQTSKETHKSRRRRRSDRRNSEKFVEQNEGVDKNAILLCKDKSRVPVWQEPNKNDNYAWKLHLKTLLYEKACLAYSTLAEYSYSNDQFGFSLKYIDLAAKCQNLLSNFVIKSQVVDMSCLLGRAGDCYFQISKNFSNIDQITKQFEIDHQIDKSLRLEFDRDFHERGDNLECETEISDLKLPPYSTESMKLSCEYYHLALNASESDKKNELLRRLASVTNELGVKYMHSSQEYFMKYYNNKTEGIKENTDSYYHDYNQLAQLSLKCLNEATAIFEQVNDRTNLALLYCNMGRYMRFKAHCTLKTFGQEHKSGYNKAEENYLRALSVLGSRETCPMVWDTVCWEMSSSTYAKATLMQENPDKHEAGEVIDALQQALKYCIVNSGARQYLYQFRAAMIYHKLGSLYHSQYRETTEDGTKRRALLSLTRSSYTQAANLFAMLEDTDMYLTVQLEHVALMECQANNSPNLRLKSLQTALELLTQCSTIIKIISERDVDKEDKQEMQNEDKGLDYQEGDYSLMKLFENRMQYVLKNLIQYCRSKTNKDYEKFLQLYKVLYSLSLKIEKYECSELKKYASCLYEILVKMEASFSEHGV